MGPRPSFDLQTKKNASKRSGAGISHTLMRVTMPKLDWEKSPSSDGPTPHRLSAPVFDPSNRLNPVSMHSPVGSTTSKPQALPQWSPIGVWPNLAPSCCR